MCGIYFSNDKKEIKINNKFLLRGPDYFNKYNENNFSLSHSLLSLTGEFTPQPIQKNGVSLIFNGQIYNYDKIKHLSDGYFILEEYFERGTDFWKKLDGEYAIIILDSIKNRVIFATDVFGTKPLFYSLEDNVISISSLKSTLEINQIRHIVKCKPNTIYSFDFNSNKLQESNNYFKFNLEQYKNSYDGWNEKFLDSIDKRFNNIRHDIVLPLSSGHDSGAIACAFDILNISYFTYSIFNKEHRKVLSKRLLRRFLRSPANTRFKKNLKSSDMKFKLTKHLEENCDSFYYGNDIDNLSINGMDDPGAIGLSYILKKAKKHNSNIKIVASGQGGDEIYSTNQDYTFDKPNPKVFDDNLSKIFPWQNFFYGAQMSYLSKEESIGGSFGLETRYPFLDTSLVQEYLNLTPELKNSFYKAPITNFLEINNYSYRPGSNKSGFNPGS